MNAPTAPGITTQPQPQTACSGSPATFTVAASGGSNSYAWYKHSNAGWGNAWTISGSGSTFLQTSAQNNNGVPNCNSFSSFGDINTPGGNSWGLYGGGGESVARVFPAALTNGQVFQIDMDNGAVDNGVQNGFALQTSGGTFLMSFYFLGGGSDYVYYDTSAHTTTVGWTTTGLRVTVIVGEGSPATYSLKITPCGGSTVDYTGTFAAAGAPGKVVVYNNNTSGGDANNLYFNSMFAGSAYDNADNYSGNWSGSDKGDTTPISGATGTSYTTSTGSNGDLYYAIAYNGAGYAASTSALLTVNLIPAQTITPAASAVCAGSTGNTASVTTTSGAAYLWSITGGTITGGGTSSTVTYTAGTGSAVTLSCVVTSSAGCASAGGQGTSVTINAIPGQTITPAASAACAGSTGNTADVTTTSGATYSWSITGGTITAGGSSSHVTYTAGTGSAVTLSCVVTSSAGCASAGGQNTSVTVNAIPGQTITPAASAVCAGSTGNTASVTTTSGATYAWSITGGTITAGGSSSQVTYTAGAGSAVTLSCVVTSSAGCASAGGQNTSVTVNAIPGQTITPAVSAVCAGSTGNTADVTTTSGATYSWSITGGTITAGGSSSHVTYTAGTGSAVTLSCVVTSSAGCASAGGQGTSVTINAIPGQTITPAVSAVCAGSTGNTADVTTTSGATYSWSITGGTITAGGSSSHVTYTAGAGSAVTLSCVVTSSAGCASAGGQSASVTVNPLPAVTTDTTNQTACAGSPVTWSVVASGTGLAYQWQRDGTNLVEGVDNFTGTTTGTLTNSAVAAQDGLDAAHGYACVISIGTCSVTSTLASLTVNAIPDQTITPAASSVCAGSTGNTADVTVTDGATYLWSITGGTITEGGTSSTVTYTAGTGSAVTLSCVVASSAGCASLGGQNASVTVNALPVAPVSNVSYNLSLPFSLKIDISDLLTNWTGTSLSVQSVANSADGGTVTKDSTYIFYTPPIGSPTSPDTIPYTVSGAGGCATAASIDVVFVGQPGRGGAADHRGGRGGDGELCGHSRLPLYRPAGRGCELYGQPDHRADH